jgi:MAX-like protein X
MIKPTTEIIFRDISPPQPDPFPENCSLSSNPPDTAATFEARMSGLQSAYGYKERRREAHTQAEQKRRDAIKKGYEDLQHMVPTCQQQDSISSYKLSKATILQRSIEYIQTLHKSKSKHDNELKNLRKELCALQVMSSNYEQMLRQHQLSLQLNHQQVNQGSEQIKFEIFQALCDSLFDSFERYLMYGDFKQLSASIFTWLEEHGKPQTLRETCLAILRDFYTSPSPSTVN